MNDSQEQTEIDQSLFELRSRLAERIGYLAARRWLANRAMETGETPGPDDPEDDCDAQRTLSYNDGFADPADSDR